MILDNKWYEVQTVQDSGFFTDLQNRSREKIVWFPKIYYQMDTGLLHIRCEISLGKYQDQLLDVYKRQYQCSEDVRVSFTAEWNLLRKRSRRRCE